jgi:hypothetical protein
VYVCINPAVGLRTLANKCTVSLFIVREDAAKYQRDRGSEAAIYKQLSRYQISYKRQRVAVLGSLAVSGNFTKCLGLGNACSCIARMQAVSQLSC